MSENHLTHTLSSTESPGAPRTAIPSRHNTIAYLTHCKQNFRQEQEKHLRDSVRIR